MTDTNLNTPGNGWEKIQQVEFESLYTGLREIDDVSQLQSKLTIAVRSVNAQIPLFKSLNLYSSDDCDPLYGKSNKKAEFELSFPNISKKSWLAYHSYISHSELQWILFNIKQCFEYNNNYIFTSDLWSVFMVNKEDFNKDWYMAKSLKMVTPPKNLWILITNISDNDWTIKYYLDWKLEWTLQWQCFTYVGSGNGDVIYVWNKSHIYKSTLKKVKNSITNKDEIRHDDEDGIDLELWEIKKIALDPKQNFLFIISEDEEWTSNLHILDHKKLLTNWNPIIDEIKAITWVSNISITSDWNIILTKTNWIGEILKTNLNTLDTEWSFKMKTPKVKKWENQTVKDVLNSLWWLSITLDTSEVSNEWSEDEKKIIDLIWGWSIEINWTSKTLKELFEDASTENDIEMVRKAFLQIIKNNSNLNSVSNLLKQIENKIINKKNEIILNSILSDIWDISTELESQLEWETDLKTLITIKERLKSIQRKRKNIAISTTPQDKTLKLLLEKVNTAIKSYQETNKEDFIEKIENNLLEIKKLLDSYDYITSITKIRTTSIRKETEEMLSLLDNATKRKYETKMNDLEINRIEELKKISDKEKDGKKQEIIELKNSIKWEIEKLKLIFSEIDEIDMIEDLWESNEVVKRIKEKSKELPNKDADEILLSLNRTLEDIKYKSMINSFDTEWIVRSLDNFWIDTSLYYNEDWSEKVEWKLSFKEKPNWKIALTVILTNWETHKYDKSVYLENFEEYDEIKIKWHKIKFEMTEEEFDKFETVFNQYRKRWKQEIQKLMKEIKNEPDKDKKNALRKQLTEKKEYYKDARYVELLVNRLIKHQKLNPRGSVPPLNTNYIVLDEEKEILKTLSSRLRSQKKYGWIDILEWWPWLWKTVMCEFLASVTNREIVRVSCSKMDPNDMFFSTDAKNWETIRTAASWITLMQKPGTIILFDEIDKLNSECVEKLHSLFDTGRSVYDPKELWTIKANPDCLFLWTRNSYDTLSNPIASRSRILKITYPSERNEAYKISKYADNTILKRMWYEKFDSLYDKYVMLHEPAPKNEKDKKIYEIIVNIGKLIQIFTKLRKLYDDSNPYNYELSYRDAQQIFVDYNWWKDFKTAVIDIILPKSSAVTDWDKEDKDEQYNMAKRIIDETL